MKFRQFGKSSLKVSEIGMGCWAMGGNKFGNSYGTTDDEISLQAIKKALELGCNFFDTADVYGHGHSEQLLGKALKDVREKVIIATKVGGAYIYGEEWGTMNFSEKYIRFALEKSLERLQTDYIDIYQLHNPPLRIIQNGEVFSILRKLQKEGKIKQIGISIHTLEEGVAAVQHVDSIQCVFNMLDPRKYELMEEAKIRGVAIIVREPLANGFLTDKMINKMSEFSSENPAKDQLFEQGDIRSCMPSDYIGSLIENAKYIKESLGERKETLAQLALRYVLSFRCVSTVISGIKTPQQAQENLSASDIPDLTDKEMSVLGS